MILASLLGGFYGIYFCFSLQLLVLLQLTTLRLFLVHPETIVFGVDLYFAFVYFFATRSLSSVSRSLQNFAL